MGFHDYHPAFCGDCGANFGVMVDQHGDFAIVCSCLEGRYALDDHDEIVEWLEEWT